MSAFPWIIRRRHTLDDVKMPSLTLHERIMQDGKLWREAYNAGLEDTVGSKAVALREAADAIHG